MFGETATRDHYNGLKYHSKQERAELPTLPLQVANNRVKQYLVDRYIKRESRILDIACGKGGDGYRLLSTHPQYYVGFDLSEKSIQEARVRHPDHAHFFVGNMTLTNTYEHDYVKNKVFDVVSTQFCLHYVWPEMEQVVKRIAELTAPKSFWIGTVVDDHQVLQFKKNAFATVDFAPDMKKYKFSLPPLVVDCYEYVLPWHRFIELTSPYFRLVESHSFRRLGYGDSLCFDLKKVHYLYRYFALERL